MKLNVKYLANAAFEAEMRGDADWRRTCLKSAELIAKTADKQVPRGFMARRGQHYSGAAEGDRAVVTAWPGWHLAEFHSGSAPLRRAIASGGMKLVGS
jgi:hypothetical protein